MAFKGSVTFNSLAPLLTESVLFAHAESEHCLAALDIKMLTSKVLITMNNHNCYSRGLCIKYALIPGLGLDQL